MRVRGRSASVRYSLDLPRVDNVITKIRPSCSTFVSLKEKEVLRLHLRAEHRPYGPTGWCFLRHPSRLQFLVKSVFYLTKPAQLERESSICSSVFLLVNGSSS